MPLINQLCNRRNNKKKLCCGYFNKNSLMPEPTTLSPNIVHRIGKRGASLCTSEKASLTVEAALTFPLVLIVIAALLWYFQVLYVETGMEKSMDRVSRMAAASAPAFKEKELSITLITGLLYADLKKSGCNMTYLEGGVDLSESKINQEGIDLIARYRLGFPFTLISIGKSPIVQRTYARKWLGYGEKPDGEEEEWVYITETGSVYHKTRHCTHLELTIMQIMSVMLPQMRNASGEKYFPCERCGEEENIPMIVYITKEGDRYHYSLGCSGLKRTVYMVRLSQTGGRRPCSKCSGGEI